MKAVPTALYLGGVPRRPFRTSRRALLLALQSSATLHLSLLGSSVLEDFCHKPLVPRLVAAKKSHQIRHLELFDPARPLSSGDTKLEISRKACLCR